MYSRKDSGRWRGGEGFKKIPSAVKWKILKREGGKEEEEKEEDSG